MPQFTLTPGFNDADRATVARLYWAAFSAKLNRTLGPTTRAEGFFAEIMDPEFAITARNTEGTVIGVVGYKTAKGALTDGSLSDLARHYGWFAALWKGLLLSILERGLTPDVLLMDGICVDASARGLGVGTALLHAIKEETRTRNLTHVRLDVIDINPRARALYEREGFVAGDQQHIGPLRLLFGFSHATPMIWSRTPE